LFAFEVDSVQRGQVPERTIVDITVDKRVRGPDGQVLVQSSSNSIGSPPKVGGRYRVEAYRGDPGGHPRLFVNACGGSLRPLAMAATKRPQEPSIPVAVAPLVVVASTAAVYLWRRPWGRRAPDAPAPTGVSEASERTVSSDSETP
jgi:hypothetical protein